MVIRTRVLGRHFLKNELNLPLKEILCQWKNSSSQEKIRIFDNLYQHLWVVSFSILKDYSVYINGDTDECDILILHNKMCQQWEYLLTW